MFSLRINKSIYSEWTVSIFFLTFAKRWFGKKDKITLANLGKAGIRTVCYNFMPVIDWIRTDLQHPWEDGTSSLYFDRIRFAYFDLKILERENAEADYSPEELDKVAELDKVITESEKAELVDTIIVKTQGFVNGNIKEGDKEPVTLFKRLLALYKGIDWEVLREICVISCLSSCRCAKNMG